MSAPEAVISPARPGRAPDDPDAVVPLAGADSEELAIPLVREAVTAPIVPLAAAPPETDDDAEPRLPAISRTASPTVTEPPSEPEPVASVPPRGPTKGRLLPLLAVAAVAAAGAVVVIAGQRSADLPAGPPSTATGPLSAQSTSPPATAAPTSSAARAAAAAAASNTAASTGAASTTAASPTSVSPSPTTTAAVTAPGPATKATATAAPTAAPSAAPAPKPYDPGMAQSIANRQAAAAAAACRALEGPRVINATLVFAPSGQVERVAMSNRNQGVNTTTYCVKSILRTTTIPPFAGQQRHRVTVTVTLP